MAKVHKQIGSPDAPDWEGARVKDYSLVGVKDVKAKVIIGPHDGDPNYYLRYFRVEPGGNTVLDQHAHDHGVYILHGRAEVLLGEETVELEPTDVVYIPGDEVHQFRTIGSEPLGFLCIVPSKKD
jgi:quercetin dioxygenase-like cupin family protein